MSHFHDAKEIKDYMLAGNATVTMSGLKARYTYKVSRAKNQEPGAAPLYFVALLSGPDNESDYTYMGVLNGTLKLTKKSAFKDDSIPVRAFRYVWAHVSAGNLPPQAEVRHEGSCGRCGRKLTTPESIDRGIGPECWSKMGE